jgi:hypothetical protein
MAERSQQPIGNRTPKHSLRVVIGKAIDLFISAMAILLTRGAMVRFFKRRRQVSSRPRAITRTRLDADVRNQPRTGHQTSEINFRGVTWMAVGLMILVIAVLVTAGGLFSLFKRQYPSESAASREITAIGRLPPAPRLQTNPASDLQQLLAAENAKLNSYGWIDKNGGLIRIPIERAMDLLAQRGLPARGIGGETGGKTPLQMRQEKAEASNP